MTWIGPIILTFAAGAGFAVGLMGLGALLAKMAPDDDADREWP